MLTSDGLDGTVRLFLSLRWLFPLFHHYPVRTPAISRLPGLEADSVDLQGLSLGKVSEVTRLSSQKGNRELWIRMVYAEGAGEAVFQVDGNTVNALAKWSCGV